MTLTYEQAVAAANAFLEAQPFPYPEYRYVLTTGRPVSDGWYFDFAIERVDGTPLSERDAFAGAPGYIVPSGGKVRVVGWKEWHDLKFGGR